MNLSFSKSFLNSLNLEHCLVTGLPDNRPQLSKQLITREDALSSQSITDPAHGLLIALKDLKRQKSPSNSQLIIETSPDKSTLEPAVTRNQPKSAEKEKDRTFKEKWSKLKQWAGEKIDDFNARIDQLKKPKNSTAKI